MRIEWSKEAVADLKAISEHIELDRSLDTANRVTRAIYDVIQSLGSMPYRGRNGRVENTRELVVPRVPYKVVYRILDRRVVILDILHGAQRWPP